MWMWIIVNTHRQNEDQVEFAVTRYSIRLPLISMMHTSMQSVWILHHHGTIAFVTFHNWMTCHGIALKLSIMDDGPNLSWNLNSEEIAERWLIFNRYHNFQWAMYFQPLVKSTNYIWLCTFNEQSWLSIISDVNELSKLSTILITRCTNWIYFELNLLSIKHQTLMQCV